MEQLAHERPRATQSLVAAKNDQSPAQSSTKHPVWVRACFAASLLLLAGCFYFSAYEVLCQVAFSILVPWRHGGTVARPGQLTGEGRIYLVQLGPHDAPYTVVDLAAWLREKYSLETQILPALPLEKVTYDASRHQYVAERINDQIGRSHPELAADPKAFVVGFTDAPMYSATERYNYTFSQRDGNRTAVISAHEMAELRLEQDSIMSSAAYRLSNRLRRILLKDVAVLLWHLPLNNDPGSVLYYSLDPYLPGADVYESDLDPLHSKWGLYISDPCIVFTHTQGSSLTASTPLIQQCSAPENPRYSQLSLGSPEQAPDTAQERVELHLAYGSLTEKHTDFFLPGPVPVRLERAISNQWQMPSAFGLSGSHNYDRYLVSHDGMRHIAIGNAGSADVVLARRPYWLPLIPFNKWTETNGSGSALSLHWRTQPSKHFDLTRFNGEIESYMPCTDAELCYLSGYQDPAGQALTVVRDGQRNLLSLSAPRNNWLQFTHDDPLAKIRVTSILDSNGRSVRYAYNLGGQLAGVAYPSGETITYTWDSSQNLLSVASSLAGHAPMTLITNHYDRGHLVAQTLADGSTFHYAFLIGDDKVSRFAQVTTPDGTRYDISFGDGSTIYSSQYPQSTPAATNQRAI